MESGPRTPRLHRWMDAASGALLMFLAVWTPWTFGGTVPWSERVLNVTGWLLGILLLGKQVFRLRTGFTPPRWTTQTPAGLWAMRALAILGLLILEYLFVSWLNARASLNIGHRTVGILYHSRAPFSWLPSSYDAPATLRSLGTLLALTGVFWAARDWLVGRSRRERRGEETIAFPPERVRRILWTLCLSSGVLAVVSIAQRLDGTDELLWLRRVSAPWQVSPVIPNPPGHSWGPFPSQAAGAVYFNLVWPVVLGFWWSLRLSTVRRSASTRRIGDDASLLLPPVLILTLGCPLMAGGRIGALLTLGMLGIALLVLSAARWPGGSLRRGWAVLGCLLLLAVAGIVAGTPLQQPFDALVEDLPANRAAVQAVTQRMAADTGFLGTGAGSFTGLYALYRSGPEERWMAHALNDWAEARITLGFFGLALGVAWLVLYGVTWRTGRGLRAPREFLLLLGISLAGALLNATFDSVFHVPSLALLVVLLAALGLSAPGTGKDIVED